jgi:hypothetical protein
MNGSLVKTIEENRENIIEKWYVNQFNDEIIEKYKILGLEARDRSWIRRSFLDPLFNLLLAYLRTGDDRYRVVYLDERLRYVPHRASPSERVEYSRQFFPQTRPRCLMSSHQKTSKERQRFGLIGGVTGPLATWWLPSGKIHQN